MKRNRIISWFLLAGLLFAGCKKYLDYQPQGAVSAPGLTSPTAVEGLSTAAYAGIANDWWDAPITSNWEWGIWLPRITMGLVILVSPVPGYGPMGPFPELMLP